MAAIRQKKKKDSVQERKKTETKVLSPSFNVKKVIYKLLRKKKLKDNSKSSKDLFC